MLSAPNLVLLTLCLLYFILYVDRVNIATAALEIRQDLGLSATQLGLAFSAFAWPYAFFQMVGGWLGDRFGPRLVLTVCVIVCALATAMTGLVNGIMTLILARLVLGFGEGSAFPTATQAMSNWTSPERWGMAQGVTHSAARLGNAITPPLIAVLIVAISWRGSFILLGVASLIWAVVWWRYFTDDPRRHRAIAPADLAPLRPFRAERHGRIVPWARLVRRILPVTAVDFCYGWNLWLFLNWIPSYFQTAMHLDLKNSALFASGVFFAGVVGDSLGGLLSDRILRRTGNVEAARRNVIVFGMLGAFGCMLPLMIVSDLGTIALCLTAAFFCLEFIVAPIWSVPMDIAPDYAGTASGLMNLGFGIAGIVSPVVVGFLIDRTGDWRWPFGLSMALLIGGSMLAFTMKPQNRFQVAPAAA
ncbi:MAG: MFS transporter [Pseudomonadota bacterium]